MLIKDYYKILDVPPAATLQDIKRAFRKLAQQYHPDKNDGNHRAAAHYIEIQEAYKVLSDPKQREDYNYKRWFHRSSAQPFVKHLLTPMEILQECRSLQRYVASINVFHVRYETVSLHIEKLFSPETIGVLQDHKDTGINHEIIHLILQAAAPLPLRYFTRVADVMLQVAGNEGPALAFVENALKQKKKRQQWDSYKWVFILLITALILVLMYWVGN